MRVEVCNLPKEASALPNVTASELFSLADSNSVADPDSPSFIPNNLKKGTKYRSDIEPGQPEHSMKNLCPQK
jgi:hypothetical protein